MSDDLTRAIAEALGCRPAGIYSATVPLAITGTWCVKHGQPHVNNWPCPHATKIAAALTPLIEARVREARAEALTFVAGWQAAREQGWDVVRRAES